MRELTVRLTFVSACLGNVRKFSRQRDRVHHFYVMPRNPTTGRVMFPPRWWAATLRKAADILCRHQQAVSAIMFSPEIDGAPQPIPEKFFRRHLKRKQYTKHEAFFPGDTIGVTCVVPDTISDDDFISLMRYAGRYCGISPAHPGEFGFYDVQTVRGRSAVAGAASNGNGSEEIKKAAESSLHSQQP